MVAFCHIGLPHSFFVTQNFSLAECALLPSRCYTFSFICDTFTFYKKYVLRQMALTYQKTGVMQPFTIQVTNEDPTSSVGRQTITHFDCLCDSFILAKLITGEDLLDEDLSGTFDDWDMPEKFTEMAGV